jgi:hypothetical protein
VSESLINNNIGRDPNRSILGYFLILFSIRFIINFCIIILFSSFNMDGKKKRKIDYECRAFNEEWGVKYFFILWRVRLVTRRIIYGFSI